MKVNESDPLTLAMAPPANETPQQRLVREQEEELAIQISKKIDAELKASKAVMKRRKNAIQVLVLGQSLSGKSTTIKNFQMTFAKRSWAEERASWRAVILLNLVRSVNIVVDNLEEVMEITALSPDLPSSTQLAMPLTERHRNGILRLTPLRQIERDLKKLLGSGASELEDVDQPQYNDYQSKRLTFQEFCVRSTSGWKSILDHVRNPSPGKDSQLCRIACQVVAGCREDIQWIWNDSATQNVLRSRKVALEDAPGFFLNDVERITAMNYEPSDQDIVRARLRTTGVQEYHFTLDQANRTALDWIIYDVAGIRTARAAWVPYFNQITALVFLASLSSFDETLAEDPTINRLEDTFLLWKTICSNKLLAKVQIILFMNKTDILRKKLESGIKVCDFIPEFLDKQNDYETVSNWFRRVFKRIYVDHTTPGRAFISHFTSVINTEATSQTLSAVQGAILKSDIADAGLL